ncbi:MAG: hypothetical protein HXY48_07665 [Ignavibacteriaceae bacterium]|nr:hypothetical protein [Ignavibacteriaceae bacterium]
MKYELKEHFCIYLDILGYSNRIEKNISYSELQSEFKYFIQYVVTQNNFLTEISKPLHYKIKIFSDNIFIALPATEKTIADFHLILQHIIDYQKTLIKANYFIRGGITKGLLYFDDEVIWGSALIEAVKLETKDTIYPFITISDDIKKLFIENELLIDTNEFLSIPIIEIIKDRYYLNYLQTINYDHNFLITHRNLIIRSLKINNDENVIKKYAMLAKYHNEFCKTYKEKLPPINLLIEDVPIDDVIFKRKYLKVIV